MFKPTVMDQIMYMRELYRADLICKDDYQGYLKLRLNEVFSPDEQQRIHFKMEWRKKRKEEWY